MLDFVHFGGQFTLVKKFTYISSSMAKEFSVGPVVRNLPANVGDMGSIPGLRRFHMLRSKQACVPQLSSLCSRACTAQQEKPPQGDAHSLQLKSGFHSLQLEKAHAATKTEQKSK